MVFNEGDRYKLDLYGKEYFVNLRKYYVKKVKVNLWWAEADEGVRIPGWPITASKRSGLLLGKEDEVETQLKQNGLVLVMSEWKGGSKYKKTRRRRRQTRRLDSNLVKRKNKLTHPR